MRKLNVREVEYLVHVKDRKAELKTIYWTPDFMLHSLLNYVSGGGTRIPYFLRIKQHNHLPHIQLWGMSFI